MADDIIPDSEMLNIISLITEALDSVSKCAIFKSGIAYVLLHNYLVESVASVPEHQRSEVIVNYLAALSRDAIDTLTDDPIP